jgi:hypothetical protein
MSLVVERHHLLPFSHTTAADSLPPPADDGLVWVFKKNNGGRFFDATGSGGWTESCTTEQGVVIGKFAFESQGHPKHVNFSRLERVQASMGVTR